MIVNVMGDIQNVVDRALSEYSSDQRVAIVRTILMDSLDGGSADVPPSSCSVCGCSKFIHYGTTKKGTPRWQCGSCGKVRCNIEVRNRMIDTKLNTDIWMTYAKYFVDRSSSYDIARKLGVSRKTVRFMKNRTMDVLFTNLVISQDEIDHESNC